MKHVVTFLVLRCEMQAKKPLFISENGLGAVDVGGEEGDIINDDFRSSYLREPY